MPKAPEESKKNKPRPVISPEAYQNRLINKAYKLAEKRIDSGEATGPEILHFLREGSEKQKCEIEKLKKENELLRAKTESIQSQKEIKELYTNAIKAFRTYSGSPDRMEDDEDD